jgi:hypothetical protein
LFLLFGCVDTVGESLIGVKDSLKGTRAIFELGAVYLRYRKCALLWIIFKN